MSLSEKQFSPHASSGFNLRQEKSHFAEAPTMLHQLAQHLQNACHQTINPMLLHGELSSGFLCGTNLTNPQTQGILINSGLIHLIVVSGAHLQLLLSFIELLLPKKWQQGFFFHLLIIIFLIFYSLSTGFQPPIVRALFLWIFRRFSSIFQLHVNSNKASVISGVLCLLVFPEWIHSFSFFLSWLVAIALCLPPICIAKIKFKTNLRNRWRHQALILFMQNLFVQILLMVPFGAFSIIGLVCNFILAPFLSIFLFPISMLAILPMPIANYSDRGWQICLDLIRLSSEFVVALQLQFKNYNSLSNLYSNFITNSLTNSFPNNLNSCWLRYWYFLAFIHFTVEYLTLFRYQKQRN